MKIKIAERKVSRDEMKLHNDLALTRGKLEVLQKEYNKEITSNIEKSAIVEQFHRMFKDAYQMYLNHIHGEK